MSQLAPLPVGRPRRLVYLGTPAAAVAPLEELVAHGFEVALVVTRPDKRRGRGNELTPSPVKAAAQRLGLPVTHTPGDVVGVGADLGVVVAYGQLIKEPVLAALPMVNLHFSLLPRWRGAAPVERALLAGDTTTGVCLMQLELELDAGPIIDVVEVPIVPRQTLDELRRILVDAGTNMLVRNLDSGLGRATPQVGEPTYASKLDPQEFEIDWSRPAVEVARLIRLGVAWTTFRDRRLKVLDATEADQDGPAGTFLDRLTVACWKNALVLNRVQPEGRPAMPALAWANGAHPRPGEQIGRDRRRA